MNVGHGAAVVDAHPRAVGVEDAHDLRVDAVIAVVGHGDGLGEPLRLVVHPPRADRVHVAPVGLLLGMLQGVAVDLRRGREHEPGVLRLGQPERLVRAERAHLQRRDRQLQVVDRAGRARPVEHHVHGAVDVDVVGDVVLDEQEIAVRQVRHVRDVAGQEVVDADDRVAEVEERFRQVRSDEAGRTGDDDAWFAHGRTARSQYACLKSPLTSVSHMIFRSRRSDQFPM